MTEIRDVEQELGRFRTRLLAAAAFVMLAFGLLGALLVLLQVVRHDELSTQAENNRIELVPIVPNRGLIVDRNGVVLANMVFNPLAAKLERNAAEEHLIGYIYTLGTLSIIRKDAPRRLEMLLNSALPPESKVRFTES